MKKLLFLLVLIVVAVSCAMTQNTPEYISVDAIRFNQLDSIPADTTSGSLVNVNGYPLWYNGESWDTLSLRVQQPIPPPVDSVTYPISIHPDNNRYFLYEGEPFIFLTSGEHYGAVLNLDFDYETYLSTLAADGLNGTRLCLGANPEYQGWFDIAENTWAPAANRYGCPWARSEVPGYHNGGNKFDLTEFDEAYFDRLKDFMAVAAENGIVVELFFYTNIYTEELWEYNPMNIINNINGVGSMAYTDVYNINHSAMMLVQKALVSKTVIELNEFDNLIYEISNEPYHRDQIPESWEDAIINTIVETEATLDKKHLISQNIGNFQHKITSPNPNTSVFNLHYARSRKAFVDNYGVYGVLGNNETGFSQDDTQYRQEAWGGLLSAAGLYNILDYSFTISDETGQSVPSGNPGGGGPEFRKQLSILADFMDGLDYINLIADTSYIKSVSTGVYTYSLMRTGECYAAYFKGETGHVTMEIPPDTYKVEWTNTRTGLVTSEVIEHPDDMLTLGVPTYDDDIALKVMPTDEEPEPPPGLGEVMVFDQTIEWLYPTYDHGGYGFYWWHRSDERGITNYGDMPNDDWLSPNDYYYGEFTMEVEVIDQPYDYPFYIQFGIWQDYSDGSAYSETVAERQYVDGSAGSGGTWDLGNPNTWWNIRPDDKVDFSRADDFYRIGVVLWNTEPLCIPKGTAWGSDGCPENAWKFFPLTIRVRVYASPVE